MMNRGLRASGSASVVLVLAVAVVRTQSAHTPAMSPYIDVHTHIEGEVADTSADLQAEIRRAGGSE